MSSRTPEEIAHELQALDAAHAQNETGRDAFIALAHTALFAASVSFVGDIAPLTDAIWQPALLLAWFADVVGLLALTVSFGAARHLIDARRKTLYDPTAPSHFWADFINSVALWSFPVALLCLFSFVSANVIHANGRNIRPAVVSGSSPTRGDTAPSRSFACANGSPVRSDPSTSRSVPAAPTAAAQAVRALRTNSPAHGPRSLLEVDQFTSRSNSSPPHASAKADVCADKLQGASNAPE